MRTQCCTFVVGFVMVASSPLAGQTIPGIVRANPNTPINGGMTQHVKPVPFERLLKDASVVLIGRLHLTRSYLTRDEKDILSDYAIDPEQVVLGVLPVTQRVPGQTTKPILTVNGGEITVDGRKVTAAPLNRKRFKPGARVLLFLEPFGADVGRYKATHGAMFEIENDRMRSLLSTSGGSDPFKDLTDRSLATAVQDIARARR